MAGQIQKADDSRLKDYRIIFHGDIRSKTSRWAEDECRAVQAAFIAFLEQHGAQFILDPLITVITTAPEPVARTKS